VVCHGARSLFCKGMLEEAGAERRL
jgi:hypothetical protein